MCINPFPLRTAKGTVMIPCQRCWQCREMRVQDWVGRCIAESKTAFATSVGTLTYGYDSRYQSTDGFHANKLVYDDVKKYLKNLRRQNVPLRYFVAGEYGTLKGRAHWHIIAFWKERKPPNYKELVRYDHYGENGRDLWPHGYSYWDSADLVKSIKYAMKYIVKNHEDLVGETYMGLSRRPPLGAEYMRYLARVYAEQGLAPTDLSYSFSDVLDREGKQKIYWLRSSSAYYYLNAFQQEWQLRHGDKVWPRSELMDDFIDFKARKERRKAGVPDESLDHFMADVWDIKLHFGGEPKQWTLPTDVAAIAVERLIASTQNQYLLRKKAG